MKEHKVISLDIYGTKKQIDDLCGDMGNFIEDHGIEEWYWKLESKREKKQKK